MVPSLGHSTFVTLRCHFTSALRFITKVPSLGCFPIDQRPNPTTLPHHIMSEGEMTEPIFHIVQAVSSET